ncbi:MAG: hypothetical protein ACOYU4_04050 [Thermodesulfobacteriota bacterium]
MLFIETPVFTRELQNVLPDESYRQLQQALAIRPGAGSIIPGTSGLRKLRWHIPGAGKRGSLRVIYYWDPPADTIYMLLTYKKSKQENLTPDQLKVLSKLVKEHLQ